MFLSSTMSLQRTKFIFESASFFIMLKNKKLVIKCHQQMIIIDREIKSIAKANPWIISEPSKSPAAKTVPCLKK